MKECLIHKNKITVDGKVVYELSEHETIDAFLTKAYWEFKIAYPKFHKMDTISKLGIFTSSILFDAIQQTHEPLRTGIIISSHSGCTYTDVQYIKEIQQDPDSSHPALFTYTLPSIVMGEICIKHKIQGENIYMITDCFQKQLLHKLAKIMFAYKEMDQCLIGWIEVHDAHSYKSQLQMIYRENEL